MTHTVNRPLKVFLCHAHADRASVRALYSRFKREGVDAWLDKEKLLPGSDWELEIRKAVREADVVVVCLSKQFNQAGFRQKEVRLALDTAMEQPEGEIFIIPARLEECDNLDSLRKWHWVDLFEEDGYQSLIRALRTRADRIGATLRIRKDGQSITTSPKGKESSQKKRMYYDLTSHYECDIEKTTAESLVNFLFESLTRIMRTVTGVDKNDNSRTAEYQTSQVEYLNPKDGKTTQHALIVHGRKVRTVGKDDPQGLERLTTMPEMLIITMSQGMNGSRLRFDSNELPNDAFKNLVEWILLDLGVTVPVQVKDVVPEKEPLPRQDKPASKITEQETFIHTVPEEKPIDTPKRKVERSESKKTKPPSKPNTAIVVALIGLIGTIIVAMLGSSLVEKWFSPTPFSTEVATATITLTLQPVDPSKTIEPSQASTQSFTFTPTSLPTEITDAKSVSMMLVPEGEFTMGSDEGSSDEKPVHTVMLEAFYMDKYEVTNALYKTCVDAGVCDLLGNATSYTHSSYYGNSQYDNYPVVYVDWNQANAYCEWRGARLPTEAEWEKAARSTDGRTFPWGEGRDCSYSNFLGCAGDYINKVGSYEKGKSPYGIYDLVGNVWEWVNDWYDSEYYTSSSSTNPLGPVSGQSRVLRGGARSNYAWPLRASDRYFFKPDLVNYYFGFRCARDANQ